MQLKIKYFFLLFLLPLLVSAKTPLYKNPSAPVEKRVADLLKRMTVEEKAAQLMTWLDNGALNFNENIATDTFAVRFTKHGLGLIQPLTIDISREVAVRNAIQKHFRENTRLGIPVLFAAECGHGLVARQATSWPQSIALGATWNPALIEKSFNAVAAEARARGIHLSFTPTVDLIRDPRWGRTEESLSEDVHLSTMIGNAIVRGLQGSSNGTIGPKSIGATLKAFVGHSQPDAGVNRANVTMGENDLRNTHLRVFEDIIAATNPAAIMPAYNAVDGIFMHIHTELLQDVLRKEWGYKGMIVSDWSGLRHLHNVCAATKDRGESAILALKAGVDLDQATGENYALLPSLVKKHPELMPFIDRSVANVLRYKFELGLFENPYITREEIDASCNLESSAQLAYEAACQSMVLLQNKDNILPLDDKKLKSIALIGAHADNMVLGGYSGLPTVRKTLYTELKRRYEGKMAINMAKGFEIFKNYPRQSYGVLSGTIPIPPTPEERIQLRKEAFELSKKSDIILLALGEDDMLTHETWTPDIPGDHATLDLGHGQEELLDTLSTLGKPIIVYMINGRPMNLLPVSQKANAILEGWYAGQEGAVAALDILFGKVNPSGKLPVSFPVTTGQLPMFYNPKAGGRRYDYVQNSKKPLYTFGYGLSYTTFSYSNIRSAGTQLTKGGKVEVSIELSNTGNRAGEEVVQLYIRDVHSLVNRPELELKAFERVHLKPGETKIVSFSITPEMLAYWVKNKGYVTDPGTFRIFIAPSSDKLEQAIDIEYL